MPSSPASPEVAFAAAKAIIDAVVWCTVTTVGASGEPRSRLMHPVWSWDADQPTALVTARPTPIKVQHLAVNPHVAAFYWDPQHHTVAVDATAEWLDRDQRVVAWEELKVPESPMGFDPATIWPDGPDSPDCAMLRFTAHRIVATPAGQPGLRWRAVR